jgi:hypothetical protein
MNDVYFIDGFALPVDASEFTLSTEFKDKQVNILYEVESNAEQYLEQHYWYDMFGIWD